jgi:hypothetical protein
MNKVLQAGVIVVLLVAFAIYVTAEAPHQSSGAPVASPFEIINGTQLTNLTVRLNKYTGEASYILDSGKKGGPSELSWVKIDPVVPARGSVTKDAPNYKVQITGVGFSAVYLLNLNTGTTWVLSGQPGPRTDPKLTWVPIVEAP